MTHVHSIQAINDSRGALLYAALRAGDFAMRAAKRDTHDTDPGEEEWKLARTLVGSARYTAALRLFEHAKADQKGALGFVVSNPARLAVDLFAQDVWQAWRVLSSNDAAARVATSFDKAVVAQALGTHALRAGQLWHQVQQESAQQPDVPMPAWASAFA